VWLASLPIPFKFVLRFQEGEEALTMYLAIRHLKDERIRRVELVNKVEAAIEQQSISFTSYSNSSSSKK
jgi:hypothetical protein